MDEFITNAKGERIHAGTWVRIHVKEGAGVGRFAGIYENPRYGWMCRFVYFRWEDDPSRHDEMFIFLKHEENRKHLLSAQEVDGPLKNRKPNHTKH